MPLFGFSLFEFHKGEKETEKLGELRLCIESEGGFLHDLRAVYFWDNGSENSHFATSSPVRELREGKREMEAEKGMVKKKKPQGSLSQKNLGNTFILEPLSPDAMFWSNISWILGATL